MEISKLSLQQKNILNELEKRVGFSLTKDLEENKFIILNWKWVINFQDFDLYNKVAEKFGKEKAKNKFEKKSFTYELSKYGDYNFWFNI